MTQRPLMKLNKLDISVQASSFHYCIPSKDFPELDAYTAVEIALFDKDGNWIQPRTEPLLADFPELTELCEQYEEGNRAVGYYVPMKLVNQLIKYLNT